jgi:2-keto-4-pentenoate hydratase/2-oxohepta-3-ene-1,7-dioic acid hydratase in catechol pathway
MRLATIIVNGGERLVLCIERGFLPLEELSPPFDPLLPVNMEDLLQSGQIFRLNQWYLEEGRQILKRRQALIMDPPEIRYAPLYRHPPKIWGIGLNYQDHARDLSEKAPTQAPASFMKPDTAIIGPGDAIQIPTQSQKTTAEAELGVVIGKRCKDVPAADWLDVVAGFTTILDMTAEDILRRNPRYLTLSKSFDTFISIGPQLVTPDEIGDVNRLRVATLINDRVHAENTVAHMTFRPDTLVSFHSQVMTLLPGDLISTGTPGAAPIQHGDRVACRISGFETLHNSVIDLKHR